MTKRCRDCGCTKELDDFHKNKATSDGYTIYCKACSRQRTKRWRGKNKERVVEQNYKHKYGVTYQDYREMLVEQDYSCKICGTKADETPRHKLFVDHCHETGAVRGLLCQHCNTGLGQFKDSLVLLDKAKQYLEDNNGYTATEDARDGVGIGDEVPFQSRRNDGDG